MKTILGLTMAMGLAATGCGATAMPRPVQQDVAIDIDTGPGGARYDQLGQPVDVDSMKKQFASDKETAGYVEGALALRILGILTAAAGGAMIGWPIGRDIAGSREPPWHLAGMGAAVALSGIALTAGSVANLDAAVGVHNGRLKKRAASLPGRDGSARRRSSMCGCRPRAWSWEGGGGRDLRRPGLPPRDHLKRRALTCTVPP